MNPISTLNRPIDGDSFSLCPHLTATITKIGRLASPALTQQGIGRGNHCSADSAPVAQCQDRNVLKGVISRLLFRASPPPL